MTDSHRILIASGVTLAAGAAVYSMSSNNQKVKEKEAADLAEITASATPESFGLPETTSFGSFLNQDGVTIHTLSVKATSQPAKAVAVLIHGVGEHCQRPGYARLYRALSEAGVDVYSMDHQGHGLSGGERGYVEHFTNFIDDVETFVRGIMDDKGENSKLYLVGQSMGANIAAHVGLRLAASNKPAAGIIFMSPMFGIDMDLVLRVQDFFGAVLDKLVPRALLVDAVRPEDLSRDPVEVERYVDDPLVHHGNMQVHLALSCKWGMTELETIRDRVDTPMLILHGSSDHTTSLNAALEFFKSVSTPADQKKMARLVDMKHELLNEFGKEAIVDILVDFIAKNELPTGDKPRSEGADIDGVIELDLTPPSQEVK